jgi:hypothetical protein
MYGVHDSYNNHPLTPLFTITTPLLMQSVKQIETTLNELAIIIQKLSSSIIRKGYCGSTVYGTAARDALCMHTVEIAFLLIHCSLYLPPITPPIFFFFLSINLSIHYLPPLYLPALPLSLAGMLRLEFVFCFFAHSLGSYSPFLSQSCPELPRKLKLAVIVALIS